MRVKEIMEDSRTNMACTYIVMRMGEREVFTTKEELIENWGLEKAKYFFLNTREIVLNII